MLVKVILLLMIILTVYFAVIFFSDYVKASKEGKIEKGNFFALGGVGIFVNFLDCLGIGNFATTTALLKNFKLSADRTIPGTLNVANTLPIVAEGLIFLTVIKVEPITLVTMLVSATIGAYLGAGIVAKLDERKVELGMGAALVIVALVMLAGQLGLMPVGGNAIGLTGIKLIIAVIVNFILGALMTLGIGLYAPCMALVFALGLSPKVAFPIMMGSCAFLMPVASIKFIKESAYDRKASLPITLFGVVGVLIAAYIVKELPLNILKWVVIVVIIYTSIMMFKSAKKHFEKEHSKNCIIKA